MEENLWPQPIKQARVKDKLENTLHRKVCAGSMTLTAAQHCINSDWYQCGKRIGLWASGSAAP